MNPFRSKSLALLFSLLSGVSTANWSVAAAENFPVIHLDGASANDAIGMLAQLADMNYCIDPLTVSSLSQLKVHSAWTNETPERALADVLKQHGLVMSPNPATTVSRISTAGRVFRHNPEPWLTRGTNAPIPVIQMTAMPLKEAIHQLASTAGMPVAFDVEIPATVTVSLHWKNLSARQALSALLANYELDLTEENDGPHRIAVRRRPSTSR